jgi:hypothetical protein
VPVEPLLPAAWVPRSGEAKRVLDWCREEGDPWPRLALMSDEGWAAEGDGVAAMLIGRAAETTPPAVDIARWLDLVASADGRWLVLGSVLSGFVNALTNEPGIGADGEDAADVATKLLERICVRMEGGALTDGLVEAVLRLMWIEDESGAGSTIDSIASMPHDRGIPLLVRLLVAPAPLPIFLRLRRVLLERAPAMTGAPDLAPEWSERLREYAPAVAYRITRTRRTPTGSKAME